MTKGIVKDSQREIQQRKERLSALLTSILYDYCADEMTIDEVISFTRHVDGLLGGIISASLQIDIYKNKE